MSKKSKTKTSNSSHTVVTPTTPDWLSSAVQGLTGRIQGLGAVNPQDYVAPVSALERQAAEGAAGLGGRRGGDEMTAGSDAWFSRMMSGPAPSVSAASLLDNLGAYANPYRRDVVDATLADFDAEAGRTRATQDLAMAGQGAFGGSGAALARSQTEGELARARSSQLSRLLSDMFNVSSTLSGQDADRRQQASAANAGFVAQDNQMKLQAALDRAASDRADIATQASIGAQLRGVDQTLRQAPITTLNSQVDMLSGLPLSLFSGQTTDARGTSSSTTRETGASLGEIAQLIGSFYKP